MAKDFVRHIMNTDDTEPKETNRVGDLLTDEKGNAWIRTKGGAELYHELTDNIKTLKSGTPDILKITSAGKNARKLSVELPPDLQGVKRIGTDTPDTVEIVDVDDEEKKINVTIPKSDDTSKKSLYMLLQGDDYGEEYIPYEYIDHPKLISDVLSKKERDNLTFAGLYKEENSENGRTYFKTKKYPKSEYHKIPEQEQYDEYKNLGFHHEYEPFSFFMYNLYEVPENMAVTNEILDFSFIPKKMMKNNNEFYGLFGTLNMTEKITLYSYYKKENNNSLKGFTVQIPYYDLFDYNMEQPFNIPMSYKDVNNATIYSRMSVLKGTFLTNDELEEKPYLNEKELFTSSYSSKGFIEREEKNCLSRTESQNNDIGDDIFIEVYTEDECIVYDNNVIKVEVYINRTYEIHDDSFMLIMDAYLYESDEFAYGD